MATGLGTPLVGGTAGLAQQLCALRSGVPFNQAPPSISGVAQQGQTLTESHGTWQNSPTSFSYQWEDCNASGGACVAIAGATGSTYALTGADVGDTVRVQETATNGAGSAPAVSAPTAVVLPLPPANISPPSISGVTTEQQTLTLQRGTWSNSPTSITDQWEDCNASGGGCVPIAGATGSTYTLTATDVGDTVRVQERAANAGGAGTALSAATGVAQALAAAASASSPRNGSPPVISGTAKVGDTLSASTGTWAGTPPISYAFQWQRCTPTCATIAGANGSSYRLVRTDQGARVRVVVTALNGVGNELAESGQVGPVAAAGPTPAQIRAALAQVLTPKGKAAKIGALLKKGGYEVSFRAPGAGRLVIDWYLVPPGAHPKKGVRPTLVATASIVFHGAGQAKLKIALTSAGRRLLRRSNVVKLLAKDTYTPAGEGSVTVTRTFTVRR
jgi:hypothetical protein